MSIHATTHDSQRMHALDADLDQLAQDMNRLHSIAHLAKDADQHERFAQLEHTVNWRLNVLANVLATQDRYAPTFRH